MTIAIRLLSEWGLYPFWIDEGNAIFEAVDLEYFQRRFGLPDHVIRALLAWDGIYQAVIDWDDPGGSDWASPSDEAHFLEVGREATRLLRRHVPDDVRIEYCAADNIVSEYF